MRSRAQFWPEWSGFFPKGKDRGKNYSKNFTLQGINISHLGKRKIIFKMHFWGDMLVPWRVSLLDLWGGWKKTQTYSTKWCWKMVMNPMVEAVKNSPTTQTKEERSVAILHVFANPYASRWKKGLIGFHLPTWINQCSLGGPLKWCISEMGYEKRTFKKLFKWRYPQHLVQPWNPKHPLLNGCLVISNHFPSKGLESSSN